MRILTVEVDLKKISKYSLEQIPEEIDKIVEPYHVKWCFRNIYVVEKGYDEDLAISGAVKALKSTKWLKKGLSVFIGQRTRKLKLSAINVNAMTAPKIEKMEYYRNYFKDKVLSEDELTYPNPIVVDEKNNLLDGYTSYLLMKEGGLEAAQCLLADPGTILKKYVCGVHMLDKNGSTAKKWYTWAYPHKEPVVPGDVLVVNTRLGKKLIKVTCVDVGTAGYVDRLKKVRRKAEENDFENSWYYGKPCPRNA